MKIHVIDDVGLISSHLLMTESDVEFYSDEIQALNAAEQRCPDLVLLNYSVRDQHTPEYVALLLNASPGTRVVVVGDGLSDDAIIYCLLAGAKGYQNGLQLKDYLDRLIKAVAAGEAWVSRKLVTHLLDVLRQTQTADALAFAG